MPSNGSTNGRGKQRTQGPLDIRTTQYLQSQPISTAFSMDGKKSIKKRVNFTCPTAILRCILPRTLTRRMTPVYMLTEDAEMPLFSGKTNVGTGASGTTPPPPPGHRSRVSGRPVVVRTPQLLQESFLSLLLNCLHKSFCRLRACRMK